MAPPFRPPRPSARLVPLYDAKRDKATDPMKIAYDLTIEACRILIFAEKNRTPLRAVNGYVARHLVDKGCLVRLPGRDTSYRITLRGEAVIEHLRIRGTTKHLFKDQLP